MSNREKTTHSNGENENKVMRVAKNEEDPPPPYPGIPGADITSDTAPLCAHPHMTTQPTAPIHVTQPRAQPHVSQPGYYPRPAPSAPPQDSSYTVAQKGPSPIPKTDYPHQYAPLEPYRDLEAGESYPIPPMHPEYPRQQLVPPAVGYRRLPADQGACYPTYVHPTAGAPRPVTLGTPVAPARRDDGCCGCSNEDCESCAACLMCAVACCDCLRLLVECSK